MAASRSPTANIKTECKPLEDKSNKDASFLKSIGTKNSDLSIKLQTDTQLFDVSLSPSSNKLIKTPNIDLPKLSALRRAQITSFIDDTASERYKLLASFIDVSNIQKSESELKKLINSLEKDYSAYTKSLSDAEFTLNNIWEKEGKPQGNLGLWIQTEVQKDITSLSNELKENNIVIQCWESLQNIVLNIKSEKAQFDKADNNFKIAEANFKNYQEQNKNSESHLLSLLIEAKKFLSVNEGIQKCPICEKEEQKDILLKNVSDKISKMQEFNKLTELLSNAKKERERLYNRLQSQIEPFNKQIILFKTESSLLSKFNFSDLLKNILELNSTKDNYQEYTTTSTFLSDEVSKLTVHNESINKSYIQFNAIKSNYDSIAGLTKKCKELEQLLANAKATLVILENSRKEFIDNELATISGEVEIMYQSIHPNEGLGNVKLFLNHSFQSSLILL